MNSSDKRLFSAIYKCMMIRGKHTRASLGLYLPINFYQEVSGAPDRSSILEDYFEKLFDTCVHIRVVISKKCFKRDTIVPCGILHHHKTTGRIISMNGLYYDYDEINKSLSYENVCQECVNTLYIKHLYELKVDIFKKVIYHRGHDFAKFLSQELLPEIMEYILLLMNQL